MPRRGPLWPNQGTPWRSGSESKVGDFLREQGVSFGFETRKVTYITPAQKHTYTPDFNLENGVTIEVKGRWLPADRQKIALVLRQNPDLDLRLLFDNPNSPISKGSKTSYSAWCDKQGIPWAKGPKVPEAWLAKDAKRTPRN
jgi:hypothetical protein